MSHSLGYGTSSGDLNTGDNLSESSFLEALFGLELGHADFADDADFSSLLFVSPTDFTEFHRSLPYAGWDFADNTDDADFFASHLSPITIFRYKFDKMLIVKGFVCVTDGLKWGFIPHASLTILALSLTILLML